MSTSLNNTVDGAATSDVASPSYIPYKVKLERDVSEKSPNHGTCSNKDFYINLVDISMEKLIMMMRTEAIHMKDYIESMPPSQSSQLTQGQMTRLMSEHVALSAAEILHKTEHQLLLAISKQLETIDEFDAHLSSNITSGTVNAMQDLCSMLNKQHSCMRSQQHKLPEPSSSELGSIIMRLEKIAAHMYLNIPKLKLETTPSGGRNGNSLRRCNSSLASPSKLLLKITTVMSKAARRQEEVKVKEAAAAIRREEDAHMIGENQIFIEEETIPTGEDIQDNFQDDENDALMIDPGEVEDEAEVQVVHRKKQKRNGGKKCSNQNCRILVIADDPHSSCTSHSPCMSSLSFDPTACTVCLDVFQKANSGDTVARRVWQARLRSFRAGRQKKDLPTTCGSWASPAIAARFRLTRIGQGSSTAALVRKSPTPYALAPVPPLIRIEMQNPEDEQAAAEREASQQQANNEILNWKAVINNIDEFFGRPDSPAIPYIRMVVSMTDITSTFIREMLMLLLSELEEQLTLHEFNGVHHKSSERNAPRFDVGINIQNKRHGFQRKLLAVLVNHDIPMSHIECQLSPLVGVLNKSIAALAAQEWLSPEQSGMLLSTAGNWETQFVEGSVKIQLQSLQLSKQALHSLQLELLLQLQPPSTVAAKRLEDEVLMSPGVRNGETPTRHKANSGSSCHQQEAGATTPSPPPSMANKVTRTEMGTVEQQHQEQYLLQHLSLKRVGDKSSGLLSKKVKTSSPTASTSSPVGSHTVVLKPIADADLTNEGILPTVHANELCEQDRLVMRQQRALLTQMEMPLPTAIASKGLLSSQPTSVMNPAQQPLSVSNILNRAREASVDGSEELSRAHTQRAQPDLQQTEPSSEVSVMSFNGVRRDSVNALQLTENTSTTAPNSPAQGHGTPTTANLDLSLSAVPSHSRKQLAPRRTMRLGSNRTLDDKNVSSPSSSSVGDARAGNSPSIGSINGNTPSIGSINGNTPSIGSINGNTQSIGSINGNTPRISSINGNTPSIGSINGNSCSSISSGGSNDCGSRRASQDSEDDSDVCEIVDSSYSTLQPSVISNGDIHGNQGSIQSTKSVFKSISIESGACITNGIGSSGGNGVISTNENAASRINREVAPNFGGCNGSKAIRSYPSATKRYVNGTTDGLTQKSEEAEPHPGEGWFQAPAPALFKMIDNEFVMRFHGNMYKSPEVDLQYFNKKMWFKVILNCIKTIQLLKYVQFKDTLNSRNEKAKVLRLDVFKRMTQIFSKSFTPTASVSNKNFCSINIEHFPSQIQHLIYKQNAKEASQPLPSTKVQNDEKKFNLEKFLERHWIYDLCSTDEETQNFLNYMEQKDPSINSYSALLNNTDELVRLKEEESVSRARLLKMSTILCGQELITDMLSKVNAQIDNTYTQQFRISNGCGVDESATASGIDTGLGSLIGRGLRSTPVERSLKETLIQLEQFHRGVETQSNSLMAVLMEEAAACKLNWRRLVLNDETSVLAQRLLKSNVYTVNVFDEAVVEEVRKELKMKIKRTHKKKGDEQGTAQQSSGTS